ncbi:hypothetical protein BGZ80_006808 [Entomortierella chlamydospora]|uniref:DUF4604 domain-containing protein n=1 Tax=Entomortierella chlamydospora TaxID=101097 RepID=A0A9P6MGC5_9FUNG|nr:hypothetical protein BGZ79_000522 [Entomortierella chlamydospora]KAF9998328.1 hypothetical protein BGZ80_006808 [Entomortierella chlamydospora]
MSDKKVTPHQMRKGLTYVAQGPDFMRMLTGQSSSAANNDPRNPYKKPIGIEAKFQTEEEDDDDETAHDILNEREEERPTVVVLKDGKHLDERQVRNVLKNLPPGLSEAEIQKRLAEEMDKVDKDDGDDDEDDDDDDDQEPVDANGKILFRRPKGSKIKAKKQSNTTSSTNKRQTLEEIISEETAAKANALKRKAGAGPGPKGANSADKNSKKEGNSNNGGNNNSSNSDSVGLAKKKKQKIAKSAMSLLSFDDEE